MFTLPLVGGFLLGVALSVASARIGQGRRAPRIVEDIRALAAIGAALLLVVLVWNRLLLVFPPEGIDASFARAIRLGRYGPEHILAAVVGFYFGSRS